MRTFKSPPIDTRDVKGKVDFDFAFQLTLDYDGPYHTATPHGERMYRGITDGSVRGRINGTVYPNGGGEFGLKRDDGVEDLNAHILLRAENGEWLYLKNLGYSREDGYYRTCSWVDADARGNYTWTQGAIFIGTGTESGDGTQVTITYYEAV